MYDRANHHHPHEQRWMERNTEKNHKILYVFVCTTHQSYLNHFTLYHSNVEWEQCLREWEKEKSILTFVFLLCFIALLRGVLLAGIFRLIFNLGVSILFFFRCRCIRYLKHKITIIYHSTLKSNINGINIHIWLFA